MPIDLADSIKTCSNWAFGSSVLNNVLSSSITLAIVISTLMVVFIATMYPAKPGTPFTIVGKLFIYMFFTTLMVVFLHDSVIKHTNENTQENRVSSDFMRGISMVNRDPVYGHQSMISPEPRPTPAQVITGSHEPVMPVVQAPAPDVQEVPVLGGYQSVLVGRRVPKRGGNPYA